MKKYNKLVRDFIPEVIEADGKKCEKLALSLTLSRRSKLYILDEPISGVDPVTREKIIDCILDRIDGKYNKYNKV